MSRLLRVSLAAAALFAGTTLIHAQAIEPAPAPEMAPAPGDEGRSIEAPAPVMPAPEDEGMPEPAEPPPE